MLFCRFLSVFFSIRSVEKARTELMPEIAQLRAKAQEEQKRTREPGFACPSPAEESPTAHQGKKETYK